MKSKFLLVLTLAFVQMSFAQLDSLSDILPLAIGKIWHYDFYHADVSTMPHGFTIDTGTVSYEVVSKMAVTDSIRWVLLVRRNFTRSIYGNPYQSSIQDSSNYEIVEFQNEHHEIYAPQWNPYGVFPFQKSPVDSLRFFRYVSTDTSGNATIQIKFPTNEMMPLTYTFWLKREIGILKVTEEFSTFGGYTITRHYLQEDTTLTTCDGYFGPAIPLHICLEQNYPNPFNPSTKIKFLIPSTNFVTLKVFDLLGREVETLVNEEMRHGSYEKEFNGSRFASGIYIYRLNSGALVQTKKMIFLK